nr:MAG TPA: Cas system-associated RAMP superfamily protein [Caudoviricetes sp.]
MTLEDPGWLSEPLRAGFPVRQGSSLKGNYRHDKSNR